MPALNSDVLPPASVAVSEELKDPAAGPHVRTEHESELALALAALQRLPEVDRAALLMRAVDEVPYDEIARALRISLASVNVKIHPRASRAGSHPRRIAKVGRKHA